LVAIVLIVVLYIVLFGLAIITWWKGRCPNCEGIENKLKRMEQRKMVDVTKEDIEEREKIRAHRASALASLESNVRQVDSGSDQDIRQTAWPNWNQFSGMAVPTQTIGINSGTSTPTLPTARCGDERSIYIGMPASPTLAYNPYSRVSRNASVYSHTTQSQRIPYAN
jgi:FtsZ-interacting cell division protein ZipA